MASVTHEHNASSAVSTGSIRSSAPSTPSASPTSCHEPSCIEKSLDGFLTLWVPSFHGPTLPRLPSPRPSQIVFASSPNMKLFGDAEYSLPNASIWRASIPATGISSTSCMVASFVDMRPAQAVHEPGARTKKHRNGEVDASRWGPTSAAPPSIPFYALSVEGCKSVAHHRPSRVESRVTRCPHSSGGDPVSAKAAKDEPKRTLLPASSAR